MRTPRYNELAALDARHLRARYAEVLAAAKARAGTGRWADERLQRHVESEEASLLISVQSAIISIEEALAWIDPWEGERS